MCLFSQAAFAGQVVITDIIKVPAGNTELFTLHAKGEQIYQCVWKENSYQWIVSPDAALTDAKGETVGKHSKGPAWKYKDGSQVIGKITQKTEGARSQIMPWLLIEAVAYKGAGLLSTVSYINRVNTQGGLEPVLPCNNNHLGNEKPVAYTADYIFYGK